MENKNTVESIENKWWIRLLIILSRWVVGATFIFSGFVKAIDPMGSVYKFNDYFVAFGLEFLIPLSLIFAVLLAAFEFMIGVNMFLGSYCRLTSCLVLFTMIFMTPLTLYLAIANPVSDCGCFGDALILTNWQTFFKNVLLLAITIFLFIFNNRIRGIYNRPVQWITVLYSLIFVFAISWIGYNYQPILDFRPYKSGLNLAKAMGTESSDTGSSGEYLFIYEKDGRQQEFTLDNYPVDDTTWTFVDRVEKKTPVIQEDEFIKDFMIISPDLGDVTDEILTNKNYQFLLLSSDIAKADDSEIDRINEIYDYALVHGYNFYCVTASSQEDIARWQDDTGAEYPFYYMDETAIKTIMRANPSMMLLKDGIIYWKRSASSLPDESVLTASLEKLSLGQIRIYNADRRIMFLALIYLVPMLILLLTEKTVAAIIVNIKNLRMKRRQEKALRSKGRKINIEKETTKNDNKEL